MERINTVIIDDESYACERLKRLLSAFEQIHVINYFTDSGQGLKCIMKYKPELLFLDVELENNISAFEFIGQLNQNLLYPYIILVTAYPHYSIKAIKNEVFDYLLKPVDVDELKATIERLLKHIRLDAGQIMNDFSILSQRESEILKLALTGKSSKEIAEALYLSINTVHTHRRNILKKTGARYVVDLLRKKNISNDQG